MAWPVTDFDEVLFNQNGVGYSEVVAIHLAIKERAEAVDHSLASGDYADEWTATPIWLNSPDGVETRTYLRNALQKFYDDIADLLSGDAGTRWTVTPTGGATEWTISSLVDDIAMGDFADLLTKPANPYPFIWLHAALDRLLYSYKKATTLTETCTRSSRDASFPEASLQAAWDVAIGDTPIETSSFGIIGFPYPYWNNQVHWGVGSTNIAEIAGSTISCKYNIPSAGASPTSAAYRVRGINDSDISVTCGFNTASHTLLSDGEETGLWIDTATPDLAPGAENNIDMSFNTSVPATVPFSSVSGRKAVMFGMLEVRAILDLTSILTDQA